MDLPVTDLHRPSSNHQRLKVKEIQRQSTTDNTIVITFVLSTKVQITDVNVYLCLFIYIFTSTKVQITDVNVYLLTEQQKQFYKTNFSIKLPTALKQPCPTRYLSLRFIIVHYCVWRFCAAQQAFHCCVFTIQWQPVFIFIISNSTSLMQCSLMPVYHTLRTGRFPRVHWHLGAKLISSFLISDHVFLCTKLISNYTLVVPLTLNLPMASQFGSD